MNRIRALREEKRITQLRLAIALGVTQETVSAYEKGKHYPSAEILLKMRSYFQVSIDYLLGATDQRIPALQRGDLNDEEQYLVLSYRKLGDVGKRTVRAYLDGMLHAKP